MSKWRTSRKIGPTYRVWGEKRAIRFQAAYQSVQMSGLRTCRCKRGLAWEIEAWADD